MSEEKPIATPDGWQELERARKYASERERETERLVEAAESARRRLVEIERDLGDARKCLEEATCAEDHAFRAWSAQEQERHQARKVRRLALAGSGT